MKIQNVTTPGFVFRDEFYKTDTNMFKGKKPFNKIQKYVDKMKDEGYTHCFMFSITTYNGRSETLSYEEDGNGKIPLFVRWKFLKVEDEIYFGENLKKIVSTLRGDDI